MSTEKKQFKGWGVLVAAFILAFIPTAILNNCFALYMNPICADLGFTTQSWSMVNLIASLTSAVGAMVIAGLYQKKNMKLMMILCTVGTCACFYVATLCTQIWQFYIVFGLENIFLAGLTQLPISMLVTAWFEAKRSTMMSIAMAGTGIGGLIWSPVLSKIIATSATGWKTAMLFSAGITLVVVVLAALFLVKRSPQEYGTEAYGAGTTDDSTEATPSWIGVSKGVAKKSGAWKACIGVVMFVGALASGVTTHVPNFITTIANDGGTLAGTILAIYSLIYIFTTIGGGILLDKIGFKKTVLLAVCLGSVGLLCLVGAGMSGNTMFAYGYSVFFAVVMCLPKLLPATLFSTVFGVKDYGSIYANLNVFFLIGAALGSVLTSILEGIMGYSMTWIVYIVMSLLIYVCVVSALKGGEALKEQYPNGDDAEVA